MQAHEHKKSSGCVASVCSICYRSFIRDGDLVSVSMAYSTMSHGYNGTPADATTYQAWLIANENICDECLQPMPEAVKKDIEREQERRSSDTTAYNNRPKYSRRTSYGR